MALCFLPQEIISFRRKKIKLIRNTKTNKKFQEAGLNRLKPPLFNQGTLVNSKSKVSKNLAHNAMQ